MTTTTRAPDSATVKRHWPFAILALLSLIVVLANLGGDYLWEDEGDTAVLAVNILHFGVPKAWDGVTFMDEDQGARLNEHLVMVTHPWGQYYIAAASFFLFGQSTFAARFPFALAGWITIIVVYFFVWRVIGNRLAAFCAAALLATSVQFLLYARQCRHYSLTMLLSCCLFWIFFRMKSVGGCALFAVTGILLFHMHPYGLVPVFALGGLSFVYRQFAIQRRWVCLAAPVIALCTLPWLALSPAGAESNTTWVESPGDFAERLIQSLIECVSVTPLIGGLILLLICLGWNQLRRWKKTGPAPTSSEPGTAVVISGKGPVKTERCFEENEAALFAGVFSTVFFFILAMSITQSTDGLWLVGMRYATAALPLLAIVAAILIAKVSRGKIVIWFPLLLIFAFTKLAQLTPWLAWNPEGVLHFGRYSVGAQVPSSIVDRFLGTGLVAFLRDLPRENAGTVGKACQYLRENAQPGDVVIANYGWEPLYFYTRLPQAMSILPKYPFYSTARRAGLPDYVFGMDHVRWILWRSAWEGVPGFTLNEIVRPIVQQGGRMTSVMEMEETVWENREDIHFHRFSNGTYLFPRRQTFPPSHIFRVDWP